MQKFFQTIDKRTQISLEVTKTSTYKSDIGKLLCTLIGHNVTRLEFILSVWGTKHNMYDELVELFVNDCHSLKEFEVYDSNFDGFTFLNRQVNESNRYKIIQEC